jgi:hypothetical protein
MVKLKNIKPGHLVLRRVANPDTVGKLQLKWEGPFLWYLRRDQDLIDLNTWMETT